MPKNISIGMSVRFIYPGNFALVDVQSQQRIFLQKELNETRHWRHVHKDQFCIPPSNPNLKPRKNQQFLCPKTIIGLYPNVNTRKATHDAPKSGSFLYQSIEKTPRI